jgi:RNA polymerase sigma factor (sigma-70 family)
MRLLRQSVDGRNGEDVTDTELSQLFEAERPRLHGVAYRMLGSTAEAEDVVQDAWLRLNRSDTREVENMRGWLTTVVARLCLDTLRTRRSRREDFAGFHLPDPIIAPDSPLEPERHALLVDSVGLAMLVVLEELTPPERLAFVLHDVFGVGFEEIAPIVDRSAAATRQLASRARRRVRGADIDEPRTSRTDNALQRRAVTAFLAAARDGNFDALVATLHPEVDVHIDFGRSRGAAAGSIVRGAAEAARQAMFFRHQAPGARLALINGAPGFVVFAGGRPFAVLGFEFNGGLISAIYVFADPKRLARFDYSVLD